MIVEGTVGPAFSTVDGQEGVPFRTGRNAELVVTGLHGKYYEQVSRGNMFYAMGASTGAAIISTANNVPTLFNPLGSNVNCSIARLMITYTSGTCAPSGLAWAYVPNCGSSQATASGGITVFTNIATINALIGCTKPSYARFATTCSFTTAPIVMGGIGIGMVTMTAATANNPFILLVDYDGSLVVAPGNALSVVCTTTTTTATFNTCVCWEEVPIINYPI